MVNFEKYTTISGSNKVVCSILAGFSVFSFGFLSAIIISPNIDLKTSTNAVTQTVGPHTLSMASEESAEINITPTSEQAIYSAANDLTVSNTCNAGATISMNTSGSNNSLMRAASDDLTKTIPATTGTSLDNTSWGFSTDDGTTWDAVPASTDTSEIIYNSSEAATNETVPILFGVKIDSTLPSGTYTNDVVYTMTPNAGCLSYAVDWDLDGGTAADGITYPTTLNYGQTIDLSEYVPTREGYNFTGWSIGSTTYDPDQEETDPNTSGLESIVITAEWEFIQTVWTYEYTGSAQTWTVPTSGNYRIELWGAEGGGTISQGGGKGGYVSAERAFNASEVYYFYVGGMGTGPSISFSSCEGGGWNGGGCGVYHGSGGGGATDMRITSGAWNNATSLNSRILVAAAGGGVRAVNYTAGNAGGISGYSGDTSHSGGGASQTSGGRAGTGYCTASAGGKGYGGSACTAAGGGGAGYYGGGGGAQDKIDGGGGGGSSYISGHPGCATYTGYTFVNTVMIDGSGYAWSNTKGSLQAMPNPDGGDYESGVGHSGYGFVRVTYLGPSNQTN